MKIALLYICTGKYDIFWKDFYLSFEKNFISSAEKHYFIFTDSSDIFDENVNPRIHKTFQKDLGWPMNTLKRYQMFSTINKQLQGFDYIFFFNANLLCIEPITAAEFLPQGEEKLIGAIHPGFYGKPKNTWPYDLSKKSLSSVDIDKAQYYYQGAVNGGEGVYFLQVIEELKNNTDTDLQNNIIALWHDESHWNKYLSEHTNIVKSLTPSYLYPENSHINLKPKIFMRNKDQFGHLESIRNMKVKFSKKFVRSLYKRIKTKLTYELFNLYDNTFLTKQGIFKDEKHCCVQSDRKISVVITYYNRHNTIHKALYTILHDTRVGEILIVDDHSEEDSFAYLKELVAKLNNPKIKVIRNEVNLGMFKNKIHAVSQAKYDWVVLLDSDNTLTTRYINSLYMIQKWNTKNMYCPSFAWPLLNNESIADKSYTMESMKEILIHDSHIPKQFLNLGNFFVNKHEFTIAIQEYATCVPYAADSIFINYIWLAKGNTLYIPKDCRYIHRVHPDSTWKIQNTVSTVKFENIKNAILTLEKDPTKII